MNSYFIDILLTNIILQSIILVSSGSHLRLLYTTGMVALGKTQVGADRGLHHPGNPKASTPSRQLQTTVEHHHPASAQMILHSVEVTGLWSQPMLTADWPG